MRKLFFLLAVLLVFNTSFAEKESEKELRIKLSPTDWPAPTEELLKQAYCPLDSSANAMMVYKEMKLYYHDRQLSVITHKRIKIYTEAGLSYAEFKEMFTEESSIDTIKVACYGPDGSVTNIAPNDIHEEVIAKSQKSKFWLKSKTFAAPNAVAGCVIDITVFENYESAVGPPIYRFHEYIPVGSVYFAMNIPPLLISIYEDLDKSDIKDSWPLEYLITNKELTHPEVNFEGQIFSCKVDSIRAIEDEDLRLPDRNLVSDLWIKIKGWWDNSGAVTTGDKWGKMLAYYKEDFDFVLENPGKAKKLADSLKSAIADPQERIRKAFSIVRDRWGNSELYSVGFPSDFIDNMMKERELDGEDKAVVLCAILRALGKKDAEVLWVCSDSAEYSPMPDYPTRRMFDYAIAYIPSDSLYLDPTDRGTEAGIISDILCERLACHPMSDSLFLTYTPKSDRFSSTMVNLKLAQDDAGNFSGDAQIVFNNQAAILMRRNIREKGEKDVNKILEKTLFRDMPDAVKSFTIAADSLQKPEQFEISCKVEISSFAGEDLFELPAYPGPTFESATLDKHPPRIYPVCFGSKDFDIYNVEWNFQDGYRPLNYQSMNSKADGTLLKESIAVEYDSLANKLSLRRSYKMTQKMFRPDFTPTLERFIQNVQKCDIATISVEKFQ